MFSAISFAVPVASSTSTIIQSQAQAVSNSQQNTVTSNNNHLVFSIKNDGNVVSSSIGASSTPMLVTVSNASSVNTIKSDGPRLISSTTIKPATTQAQAQVEYPLFILFFYCRNVHRMKMHMFHLSYRNTHRFNQQKRHHQPSSQFPHRQICLR